MADFYISRQRGSFFKTILELPDYMVIDGICYDKTTLNPVFLKNLYCEDQYLMSKYCRIVATKYWGRPATANGASMALAPSTTKFDGGQGLVNSLIASQYDNSELYFVSPGSGNRTFRINRADNTLKSATGEVTYMADYVSRETGCFIFNETASRVDVISYSDGAGNNASYYYDTIHMFCIDKSTWTTNNTGITLPLFSNMGGVLLQVLAKNATYTILGQSGPTNNSPNNDPGNAYTNGARATIIAYNNATKAVTNLIQLDGDTYTMGLGFSVPFIDPTSPTRRVTYVAQATVTASFFKIRRIWWDDTTPLTSKGYEDCTISYTGTSFTSAQFLGITGKANATICRSTVITGNSGQLYLAITLTYTAGYGPFVEPLSSYKTYVFKIGSDLKTLTPTQIFVHDDKMLEMIPLTTSHQRTMWIYSNYVAFVQWNNTTECYEVKYKHLITAASIGVDSMDRIWMLDLAGKIQLLTAVTPSRVDILYELTEYNYQGSSINSYIQVTAYDHFASLIAANITLTIDGNNCTFADGSTKCTVTTLTSGSLQVPIIITNSGEFKVTSSTEV